MVGSNGKNYSICIGYVIGGKRRDRGSCGGIGLSGRWFFCGFMEVGGLVCMYKRVMLLIIL